MINKLRKVELKIDDSTWKEIQFTDLKQGDIFRLFEPTGEPVIDDRKEANVQGEFKATSNIFENLEGYQMIEIE